MAFMADCLNCSNKLHLAAATFVLSLILFTANVAGTGSYVAIGVAGNNAKKMSMSSTNGVAWRAPGILPRGYNPATATCLNMNTQNVCFVAAIDKDGNILFYKTESRKTGGIRWIQVGSPLKLDTFEISNTGASHCWDGMNCLVAIETAVIRTTDGFKNATFPLHILLSREGITGSFVALECLKNGVCIAAAQYKHRSSLYRTKDRGLTWREVDGFDDRVADLSCVEIDQQQSYCMAAAESSAVHISVDDGMTWMKSSVNFKEEGYFNTLCDSKLAKAKDSPLLSSLSCVGPHVCLVGYSAKALSSSECSVYNINGALCKIETEVRKGSAFATVDCYPRGFFAFDTSVHCSSSSTCLALIRESYMTTTTLATYRFEIGKNAWQRLEAKPSISADDRSELQGSRFVVDQTDFAARYSRGGNGSGAVLASAHFLCITLSALISYGLLIK